MFNIQVITDEWIDIIYLNENKVIRKTTNDTGIYTLENNILFIEWDEWGKEEFKKIDELYYNCKNTFFEIYLENNDWNDICIFDIKKKIISRKYNKNELGLYYFDNNDLIIVWNNWGIERFYQLKYGKYYTNTSFGNLIKNNIIKQIKIIAIVFPQFHEIPENNAFWGKGFTEWTLLKEIPRIVNNEIIKQPHPDIGYFNLKDYEHRKYMRTLANKFNIYGFCYYHYWFKDKKIMYEPTELMLLDGEPNLPFFFCWANEQWTKRWDGGNNEVLLEQNYTNHNGNINHFNYLLQFFKNKNYIKKFNKPIFIFYRIEEKDIEQIKNIINLWNNLSKKEGFNGIHFMKFLGPFDNNIILSEIDGYVEFEPGYCTQKKFNDIIIPDDNNIFDNFNNVYNEEIYLKKNADIRELVLNKKLSSGYEHYSVLGEKEKKIRTSKFFIYDGIQLYNNIITLERIHKEQHRGICVNWNNTPRRNFTSDEYDKYPHYYKNINPKNFGTYLEKLFNKINNDPNYGNDFLFISAWNEWNEQAILEPNNEDGYDYLIELNKKYLELYNYPKNKKILNICHLGGGTEKYMNDLKKIFINYEFIDFTTFDENINYDDMYKNIDIIHLNSILFNNLKNDYVYFFSNFFKNSKKYITIHDYQWLFPDDPNILKSLFLNKKSSFVEYFNTLLSLSDKIIFPSYNIYINYSHHINLNKYNEKIFIVNHMDKIINHNFLVIPKINNTINIAFIGYFVSYKGSEVFRDISNNYINFNNYNINYHIFGLLHDNNMENYSNLIIHNKYNDNDIIELLHKNNIHGIVHLSQFEESYCYALTNSINSGIPIFYIDYGCITERLGSNDKYFLSNMDDINEIYKEFIEYIIKNNNTNNYYKLNNNIQPNRWYINNY